MKKNRRLGESGEIHPCVVTCEVAFKMLISAHAYMREICNLQNNLILGKGILPRGRVGTSRRRMLPSGKFLPHGGNSLYFFLVEIFLPRGNISSLRKYFFLVEIFFLAEIFYPHEKGFLLAEKIVSSWMIFSSRKWFLPHRSDVWRTHVPSGFPYYDAKLVTLTEHYTYIFTTLDAPFTNMTNFNPSMDTW